VRLLHGRLFTDADNAQHPPVMIVSATTARHLFGEDNPLGQLMRIPRFRYNLTNGTDASVIGVVADVKYAGLDAAAGDQVYMPLAQMPWVATFLAVRMENDAGIAPTVRRVVASVDPMVAVSVVTPLVDRMSTAAAPARFRTSLTATFAAIGLMIAAIGLYGLVSYSVSQRTSEIGIRMALGADSRTVVTFIMREGVAIAAMGASIGIPTAYATTRSFSALLYGVRPADPFTYVTTTIALVAVALAASYVPARRAAAVDPLAALRAE
jgi:putative ABC transport system permease protein